MATQTRGMDAAIGSADLLSLAVRRGRANRCMSYRLGAVALIAVALTLWPAASGRDLLLSARQAQDTLLQPGAAALPLLVLPMRSERLQVRTVSTTRFPGSSSGTALHAAQPGLGSGGLMLALTTSITESATLSMAEGITESIAISVTASTTGTVPSVEGPGVVSGVVTYTVQAQDNLVSIAERFGLQRETIVWANEALEVDPGMLRVGQVLYILPVDGAYHTVREGETLIAIAEQYSVTVEAIVELAYNAVGSEGEIAPGQRLVIPGGVKPFVPYYVRSQTGTIRYLSQEDEGRGSVLSVENVARGGGDWMWPVAGDISQGYWNLHRAVDIAGDEGDVVVATDDGIVVYAEWEISGYGYLVVVDHQNGYVSYYGHLYGFYVEIGQAIARGQPLGVRGDTGRSTGPHLHFEIRHRSVHVDPFGLLPEP